MSTAMRQVEAILPRWITHDAEVALRETRQGRLQYTFSILAAFAALASGFEAYAQHRRGNFHSWLMWTPVALTPPMVLAGALSFVNRHWARQLLPWLSLGMIIDGLVGFVEHVKGVGRLPGGFKFAVYNITMGPPIFAPLFFLSVGLLGWLAAVLRPERLSDFTRSDH